MTTVEVFILTDTITLYPSGIVSVITSRCYPKGNEPHRSMATICHGLSGRHVHNIGMGLEGIQFVLHHRSSVSDSRLLSCGGSEPLYSVVNFVS